MPDMFSKKQLQFILESKAKWNIAHGSIRTGKTVGLTFRFMEACAACPDNQLFMVGKTAETAFDNAIRLIFDHAALAEFRPFCTWMPGARVLKYRNKSIKVLGAKDEGALGVIMGKTMSVLYCDEITLYPDSIIVALDGRLSMPYSIAFATCNPSYPDHIIKKWIDAGIEGDKNYYSMHYTLEDNPFVDEGYKQRLKMSHTGLAYKRNYLGLWCLAEGAIFDFFDRKIHTSTDPKRSAEYFIAGIDFGMHHNTACIVVGVSTGKYGQNGRYLWVQDEYIWDIEKEQRQKTVGESARDIKEMLEPYGVRYIYIDPSAAALQLELERMGVYCIHANNDVLEGINYMTSEMVKGNLAVLNKCTGTIRSIERYTWDEKAAKLGKDKPIKRDDDAVDALRYAIYSHKVPVYENAALIHNADQYRNERFNPGRRSIF